MGFRLSGEYRRAAAAFPFRPIGRDWVYVLDATTPGLPVLCLSHETHEITPEWPTFEAFETEWRRISDEARCRDVAAAIAQRRRSRLAWLLVALATGLPLAGPIVLRLVR